MSLNIQPGDLVQCRLRAGAHSYLAVREVVTVRNRREIVVTGDRRVSARDVLAVIPVNGVCAVCFCRPCECEEEFDL